MAQLPALTQLYAKISNSLTDEDVRNLRAMLTETLGAARVQNAVPIEIFNMLQRDNKISKGDLGLLVQILRSLGKGRLAEEAEQLQQQQRTEAQGQAQLAPAQLEPMQLAPAQLQAALAPVPVAMQQTAPMAMSEAHRTLLLRNYPILYQDLDATRVLGYLHEYGVLTEEMRQDILTIPEEQRHLRTRRLLDLLLQMDDNAFTTFRTALGHAGYRHLMLRLTGGQHQHVPPMPMALAIYTGPQGSEHVHVSTGELPHGQLTIPNEHLLTTVYQKKQVLQLKKKIRDEELKEIYRHQKKQLKIAHKKLSQESFERKFDQLQAKVEAERAIIVGRYRGCVILFLTFESAPKFEHFWGSCTSGDLSTTLSELLLTEEMRGLEGGDQLVVKTLVLEQDVTAWRDFFAKGDLQHLEEEQVEQVTSQLASMGASGPRETELRQRAGSIGSVASIQSAASTISAGSVLSSDSGYASAGSHMTLDEGKKLAPKYKAEAEAAVAKMTEVVGTLDSEITATKQNCQEVEKEIQQHYKQLRSKLKQEEQEMITTVQKVNRDRKGELSQEKKRLQTELGKTEEDVAFCEKILDCKDDKEFFTLRQRMEERFQKPSLQQTGNRSLESHTRVIFQPCRLSQASGGSLSVLDIEGPVVESLSCSVTVTPDSTVGLTGGDVAAQIEVTSPQGKTTLIQTTAHTSPPLAAGKGQTSRARRVWGGEWRNTHCGSVWGIRKIWVLSL